MMSSDPTKTSGLRKISSIPGRLEGATAFQRIARDGVARVKAHHSGAGAGNAEAVHQIRVAFTWLRAAVSFFAPMTTDVEWRRLKKEVAWLNASLGAARDSDVTAEYVSSKRYLSWARQIRGRHLDAVRVRDHRRLVRCLHSRRFQDLIGALSGWIEHGSWLRRWKQNARGKPAEPLQAYCARQLKRWHRRLIRKGRQLETLGPSGRHRLRIRTKRFRYMLEALTEIMSVRGRDEFRYLHRPARRLQRVLGDLRDLKRLAQLGTSAGDGNPGGNPLPGYRQKKKKLLSAAIEAYGCLEQARWG